MTIASDLTRIRDAKVAIRQAIIDKGVDVPETELMDTYHEYIDQISGRPSGPTGDGTFADLTLALSTDNPAKYYPIGTEIPDTYNGNDNPLIVAQYLDSTNNSAYGGAEGVILVRKYVEPVSVQWSSSKYDSLYANSGIASYLATTYLDNCSDEIKDLLSDITIQCYYNANKTVKWFLMSHTEIMSSLGNGTQGIAWDLWKQRTGLSSPSFSQNSGRVIKNLSDTAVVWWLRSYSSGVICTAANGASTYVEDPRNPIAGVLPACFVSKDTE